MEKQLINQSEYKNIIKTVLIIFCFISFNKTAPSFAANGLRSIETQPISVESPSSTTSERPVVRNYVKQKVSADSKITKFYATVNKTELIKFDERVKRISITNPALADLVMLSPKEMLINGKEAGTTSLIIWGASENPVFFDLVVRKDNQAFLQAVKEVAPDENAEIKFTDDGIILSGTISSTDIKDKIKSLATAYGFKINDISESPTKQVLLEVKVAEASRAFTKNLSSTFAQNAYNGTFYKNLTGLTSVASSWSMQNTSTNGLQYFISGLKNNVTYALNAAETKGTVKILAEPKLITTNGEEASFNAGQQVPVPSGIGQQGNVSYEYKDIGVILKFKPTILEQTQRILLKLSPEVSELDSTSTVTQSNGTTVYGFKTRKVDTTVELGSGETLVIAGLLKHTNNDSKTQTPLVGDIPWLGRLFGTQILKKDDTELIIFVTPRIIEANETINRI